MLAIGKILNAAIGLIWIAALLFTFFVRPIQYKEFVVVWAVSFGLPFIRKRITQRVTATVKEIPLWPLVVIVSLMIINGILLIINLK